MMASSLSKDGSKRTLFLDFGGKDGQKFAKTDYGVHERILVMDSTGKLIQAIPAPKGYSFDHTEWVSDNLITAMLTSPNGAHEKLVLVDITDSSVLELLKGDELWHPSIWIDEVKDTKSPLDPDSAAAYWNNNDNDLLASKMTAFWAISDSIEVIALGSSRVSQGFYPNMLSYVAFNMATIPNDMDVNQYLLNNYIFPHCKNLKFIVLALDLDLWSEKPGVNISKNTLSIPGFIYDKNHNFWKKGNVSYIIEASKQRISEQEFLQKFTESSGTIRRREVNSWTYGGYNPNIILYDSTWSDNKAYKTALQQLEEIIVSAKEKNIIEHCKVCD